MRSLEPRLAAWGRFQPTPLSRTQAAGRGSSGEEGCGATSAGPPQRWAAGPCFGEHGRAVRLFGRQRPPRTPIHFQPWSPPFGGWPHPFDWVFTSAVIGRRTECREGDVMRLTFKLHDTSPPFVELCLETWRQDVHGGAPIISPHLMTASEIKQSCASFRVQIDRVEREAIAALHGIKKITGA
jgi:hypothetical protein